MNISPKAVSNFAEVIQGLSEADKKARREAKTHASYGYATYCIKRVEDAPDNIPLIVIRGGGAFLKGDHIRREGDAIGCTNAGGFVSDIEEGAFPKRGILAEINVELLRKRLELKRAEMLELEAILNKALGLTT